MVSVGSYSLYQDGVCVIPLSFVRSWVGVCAWCSSMVVGAEEIQNSAVVFLAMCSEFFLVAFFACLEFPFVAGSCWQRLGAVIFSSVLVAALLL